MKLSVKILLFVVAIVVVSVMSVTFLVMMENEDYRQEVNQNRVISGVEGLKDEIDKISEKAKYSAVLLAQNKNIITGVEYSNFLGLKAVLDKLNADLDLSTICVINETGDVIIRQHEPDMRGDNLSEQTDVQQALAGDVSLTLESSKDSGLSCRAAAPIENQRGAIIGAVETGFVFENAALLEKLKKDYGMEFSIYADSTRFATTYKKTGITAKETGLDANISKQVMEKGETYTGNISVLGKPYIASYMPLTDNDGHIIGVLASAMSEEDANAATMNTVLLAIYAAVAVIVVSVVILMLFVRGSIRKPMLELVNASKLLADGNMDIDIKVGRRKDEIGMLAKAFEHVVSVVGGLIYDIAALEDKVAEGHLLDRADESAYKGEYKTVMQGYNKTVNTLVDYIDKLPLPVLVMDRDFTLRYINENGAELLGDSQESLTGHKCHDLFCTDDCLTDKCVCFNAMNTGEQQVGETTAHLAGGKVLDIRYMGIPIVKDGEVVGALEAINDLTDMKEANRKSEEQATSLKALLDKINEAANLVTESARQVSEGSQVLSQGATEQAEAILRLSSSIAEISHQTQQNAENSEKASDVADKTRSDAVVIDDKMHEMLGAMNDISDASVNISKIIKTIDDIAFQTNILSLNAAVEAARAGIHGKGFAVVAEEVRSLASKSAVAAKDTARLIKTSMDKVHQGTKVAGDTAETLGVVLSGISKSAELMDQVAVASRKQSLSISQVESGVEQVSGVIQNITATAQESAAASQELSGQAVMLTELVNEHKTHSLKSADGKNALADAESEKILLSNGGGFGKY